MSSIAKAQELQDFVKFKYRSFALIIKLINFFLYQHYPSPNPFIPAVRGSL